MNGQLLKFAYQLRQHRLGGWGLDRWGITLAWGAGAAILVLWLLRGMPPASAWHWATLALLGLAGAAVLGLRAWGARRSYVVFLPQPHLPTPPGQALRPTDKVLVHATGRFEVEGRSGMFANLLAYWRTFASREHAVMAIAHESRFLGLGGRPAEDVGMWYIFFRPEAIEGITPGRLIFGTQAGPALRVSYQSTPAPVEGKRGARSRPVRAIVYLACEDEDARRAIWADLLADKS